MTRTPQTSIGQAVRVERARAGITQEELASSIGVSRVTIVSIEQGLSNPGYMIAFLLARTLGFSLDETLPNVSTTTCVCHLFGPAECRVCHPAGYVKA